MEEPERQIETVIKLCAGAESADRQIEAFQHYMMDDHSFPHPLCYIPRGAGSLRKVIRILILYRGIVWKTKFIIKACAFDSCTNNFYVDLIQQPHIRLLPFVPSLMMHCHFHLREIDGLYYIDFHEDILQPYDILRAIPILRYFGVAWFTLCQHAGLFFAKIVMILGLWRPQGNLKRRKDQNLERICKRIEDIKT